MNPKFCHEGLQRNGDSTRNISTGKRKVTIKSNTSNIRSFSDLRMSIFRSGLGKSNLGNIRVFKDHHQIFEESGQQLSSIENNAPANRAQTQRSPDSKKNNIESETDQFNLQLISNIKLQTEFHARKETPWMPGTDSRKKRLAQPLSTHRVRQRPNLNKMAQTFEFRL